MLLTLVIKGKQGVTTIDFKMDAGLQWPLWLRNLWWWLWWWWLWCVRFVNHLGKLHWLQSSFKNKWSLIQLVIFLFSAEKTETVPSKSRKKELYLIKAMISQLPHKYWTDNLFPYHPLTRRFPQKHGATFFPTTHLTERSTWGIKPHVKRLT